MNSRMIISILTVIILIISVILFRILLPFLKRLKFGQSIRAEGPHNHLTKAGTPTMGGLGIMLTMMMCFSVFLILLKIKNVKIDYLSILLLIIPTLGYATLGFLDDFLIIVKKSNQGLRPIIKLGGEILIAIIFYFLYLSFGYSSIINFFGVEIDLKFFYGPLLLLMFTGTTNATNITDGIDGLLGVSAIFSSLAFLAIAYYQKNEIVLIWSLTLIIAILAFLMFNLPKAKLFMGDTGSLLIGASFSTMAILLKCELLLIVIGFVYIIETLSVILQVWFFKRTKGKRLLKMSPFHHHLELSGFSELEIDLFLGSISLLFGIIGVYMGVMLF